MPSYRSAEELEGGLEHVCSSPADDGLVELVVRRPAENEREVLDEGRLDPAEGLVGDAWSRDGATRTTTCSSR